MIRFGIHSTIPGREEPDEEVLTLVAAYGEVFYHYWERIYALMLAVVLGGLVFLIGLVLEPRSEWTGWPIVLIISGVLCVACLGWFGIEKLGGPHIECIAKAYWPVEVIALDGEKAVVCNARRAGELMTWFHWNSKKTAAIIQSAVVPTPDLEAEKAFAYDLVHTLKDLQVVRGTTVPSPIIQRDASSFGQIVSLLQQCALLEGHQSKQITSLLLQSILPVRKDKSSGCEFVVGELVRFCGNSSRYMADLSCISSSTAAKLQQTTTGLRSGFAKRKQLVPVLGGLAKYRETIPAVVMEADRLCQPVFKMLKEKYGHYEVEITGWGKRESNDIKAKYGDVIRQCEFEMQRTLDRIQDREASLKEQRTLTRIELDESIANVSNLRDALMEDKRQALNLQETLTNAQRQIDQQDVNVSAFQMSRSLSEMRYHTTLSRIKDLEEI